VTEKRVIDI